MVLEISFKQQDLFSLISNPDTRACFKLPTIRVLGNLQRSWKYSWFLDLFTEAEVSRKQNLRSLPFDSTQATEADCIVSLFSGNPHGCVPPTFLNNYWRWQVSLTQTGSAHHREGL